MTLHDTAEITKKGAIFLSIGLGAILIIVIFVKVGKFIAAALNPPKIAPPNEAYGKLPPIVFPQSTVKGQFYYKINTADGSLPTDFPDRIVVYPVIVNQGSYEDLPNAKKIMGSLGFNDPTGNVLPEISLGGPNYEWTEQTADDTGFQRTIQFNTIDQSFSMTSDYLTRQSVNIAQYLGDQNAALATVQGFLGNFGGLPTDIDLTLTQNQTDYTTTPQLYNITTGQLIPTTSLSNTQVIRVDLYQKLVDYTENAAQNQNVTQFQNMEMKMPIMYPHPPYSTMNFLVASGQNQADVVSAIYNHQSINLQPDTQATYPIITAEQALDDLKNGKGYIAAYNVTDGSGGQILISKVYPAYFIQNTDQAYLEPIIVFEGQNGFFAYVPALAAEALQ